MSTWSSTGGEEGELQIFCAVLAWSRYRLVRVAPDQKRETTLRLLAECFEELGGVAGHCFLEPKTATRS